MRGKLYRFPPVRKSKGADHRRERSEIGHPVSIAKGMEPVAAQLAKLADRCKAWSVPGWPNTDDYSGNVRGPEGQEEPQVTRERPRRENTSQRFARLRWSAPTASSRRHASRPAAQREHGWRRQGRAGAAAEGIRTPDLLTASPPRPETIPNQANPETTDFSI